MGQDPRAIRAEIEQTRARMGDTAEALAYKADVPARMKDAVNDRIETVRGTVNDVVDSVRSTATQGGAVLGSALGAARRRASSVQMPNVHMPNVSMPNVQVPKMEMPSVQLPRPSMIAENPIGLALGALAVGLLAGLMLPTTDLERERIGPLRDDLLDRAQTAGSDAIVHGRAVVEETLQTVSARAQDAAREHARAILEGGLEPSSLVENAMQHGRQLLRETAETAVQTAQQKLQEHGRAVVDEARGSAEHDDEAAELDDELED